MVFAFVGRELLAFLGIELYSLQVAGGILLVIIGLNMLKEGEEPGHHDVEPDSPRRLALHTGGRHGRAVRSSTTPASSPSGCRCWPAPAPSRW